MKHTLEAVRKLLKEKISDAYAFQCGVVCIDTFAAAALLDLVEEELSGFTLLSGQIMNRSSQGEP